MLGNAHENVSAKKVYQASKKKKQNVHSMRLAMERTKLPIDGLTRRNVGYFAESLRAGEPAIKPTRTRSLLSGLAVVAISIVGFDEDEPTKPLTRSALSFKTASRASTAFRCVSRTRTSIYKITTGVFHSRERNFLCCSKTYSLQPRTMQELIKYN